MDAPPRIIYVFINVFEYLGRLHEEQNGLPSATALAYRVQSVWIGLPQYRAADIFIKRPERSLGGYCFAC